MLNFSEIIPVFLLGFKSNAGGIASEFWENGEVWENSELWENGEFLGKW